jgi:predicted dehydrogenase
VTLRLGLAGLGIHGSRYARHLLAGDVPGARLVAVSRRDEAAGRAFAAEHGLAWAPESVDLATLPDVDAVVVVLRPDLHEPVVLECLRAGRPVLVEKPMASDLAGARRIAGEVERTSVPLMVAQTLRFDPLVQRMREEAAGLGPLRVVALNQRFEPFHRDWIDDPGPGGIVLNTGVHGFDLIRWLSGAAVRSVLAESQRVLTSGTEDQFAAVLRLEPGGILATIDNSRATGGRTGRIELSAERGQLVGDHIHRSLWRVEGSRHTDLGPIAAEPTIPETLRRFVRCLVEEGGVPEVTAADGLATLEIADAVLRSAESGRRVEL